MTPLPDHAETLPKETLPKTVTLELPPDLAQLLQQRSQQSGQPLSAVVLAILRAAIHAATPQPLAKVQTAARAALPNIQTVASAHSPDETAYRAGSSIASLWLRVNQADQPPASVPPTLPDERLS